VTDRQEPALLRIGELSRRLGVSTHVLRAWEHRYGLLQPVRSPGGFRLYSAADEARVRRMLWHLAQGLAAAQAARAALEPETDQGAQPAPQTTSRATPATAPETTPETAADHPPHGLALTAGALREALDALDEPAAQAALDRLLADYTVEAVVRDVLMPYLHELGERWEGGTINVAQEHFASNVVRSRLAGLARGWGRGRGPRAVLACPPGELHDLPLLAFGLVLNRNGWRIAYLGADTPMPDLVRTTRDLRPDAVVLAAVSADRFQACLPDLERLAGIAPLCLAGSGATRELADRAGARLLPGDPVSEAQQLPPRPLPG
jgi:MerR family transcriptional regulator, light-induced transcriptional regulator